MNLSSRHFFVKVKKQAESVIRINYLLKLFQDIVVRLTSQSGVTLRIFPNHRLTAMTHALEDMMKHEDVLRIP